jgi:hypothetical protein
MSRKKFQEDLLYEVRFFYAIITRLKKRNRDSTT